MINFPVPSFDLSTFSAGLSFNFMESISGDFIKSSSNIEQPASMFETQQIDSYLDQELRCLEPKQFFNHDAAYKVLELSQKILTRQCLEKWKRINEIMKQLRQERTVKGLCKMGLLIRRKVEMLLMKSFVEMANVSKSIKNEGRSFKKLEQIMNYLSSKYSERELQKQGFQTLIWFSKIPECQLFHKVKKVVMNRKRCLEQEFIQNLKSNLRRVESTGIFEGMVSFMSKSKNQQFIKEAFGILSDYHDIENGLVQNQYESTVNYKAHCIQSLSPIANKNYEEKHEMQERQVSRAQKQEIHFINPISSEEFNKVINNSCKNVDTSIDLSDSTFLKSLNGSPSPDQLNITKPILLSSIDWQIPYPKQEKTISPGAFNNDLISNPVFYQRQDQQYQTLNDQPDSNIIFNHNSQKTSQIFNSSMFKTLKNSVSENDLSKKLNSIKNNASPSFKDIPCKMKVSCVDFINLAQPPKIVKESILIKEEQYPIKPLKQQKSLEHFQKYKTIEAQHDQKLQKSSSKKYKKHDFLHKLLDRKRQQLQLKIKQKEQKSKQINRVTSLKLLPGFREIPQ